MAEKKILSSGMSVGGNPGATYELYEDPANVAEIYVDGAQGVVAVGSVVKLNFFTRGFAPPAGENETEVRYTACRLVMGTDTFVSLLTFFGQVSKEFPGLVDAKGDATNGS